MPAEYNPTSFDLDYANEINAELKCGRELNALFLVHGYIEAYLRDWLFYSGSKSLKALPKLELDDFEKISFKDLLLIHLVLGNISTTLYERIDELNKTRNSWAHDIIKLDYKDEKVRKKLKKIALHGIRICNEIKALYKKRLDKIVIEIPKNATNLKFGKNGKNNILQYDEV